MTIVIVFLALWAALAIGKGTPVGRSLRGTMVDVPVAVLGRLSRINVAVAIVILMLIVLHFSAGDADPVRLVSLFAPDLAFWLASFEVSSLIEAAAGLTALCATLRRVNIRDLLLATPFRLAERVERTTSRVRCSRRRDRISPANDDEDGGALALAS